MAQCMLNPMIGSMHLALMINLKVRVASVEALGQMVGLITRVQLKTSLPRLIPTILDFWFVAGFVGEVLVFLAKPPRTYMNLSGELVNCSRKQFPSTLQCIFGCIYDVSRGRCFFGGNA
ncbi:uncharacterized protein LOC128197792 [Vigna angularis]|uniref:uncharacterized protein LOC128197792 n=1 Tax=Phaseolus angularis TaxID=3914 RepID=UPI0022B45565|nr:uncharacterized protein LOC128197792 [Vigna angularis]